MNGSHGACRGLLSRLALGLVITLGFMAVAGSSGCDDLLSEALDGYSASGLGGFPIDQDVFDAANDAWGEYIRM